MDDNKLLKKALFKFLRRGVYLTPKEKTARMRAKAKMYLYLRHFYETVEKELKKLEEELKGNIETEYFSAEEMKVLYDEKNDKVKILPFNKTDWKRARRQEIKLGLRAPEEESLTKK